MKLHSTGLLSLGMPGRLVVRIDTERYRDPAPRKLPRAMRLKIRGMDKSQADEKAIEAAKDKRQKRAMKRLEIAHRNGGGP